MPEYILLEDCEIACWSKKLKNCIEFSKRHGNHNFILVKVEWKQDVKNGKRTYRE